MSALSPCPSPAAGEGGLPRTASFAGVALQESPRHRHPSPVAGEGKVSLGEPGERA
jgi:hypothetical protein